MPSPVGHALAGVAVGWLVEGRRGALTRANALTAAAYGLAAALPDLDLLLETHRGPTHGIGSAFIAGLVAWAVSRRARTGLAFALAYGSHILLDWLGTDTTPPIGLTALWPFSREYYESPFHVFMAVSRRYWLPEFWTYNVRVLVRELLILGPAMIAAGMLRGPLRRLAVVVAACALVIGEDALRAHSERTVPAGALPRADARSTPASYVDIVVKYRSGDHEEAVKAASALETSKLDEERRMLESTPFGSLSPEYVPAAIMLHTEAHFASASGRLAPLPSPHLDAARRLARRCLELVSTPPTSEDDPPTSRARSIMSSVNAREFVRQWYLLVVSQVQGTRQISRSAHYLQEARSLFPDDADILLASGSHHESLTFIGTEHHPVIDEAGRRIGNAQINPARERREAARWFRAAVDANPGLHEAAVRLGRTLHQLGDLQAAATTLETVRARAEDPPMKYLAALFLARVEEDRGRRARAADLYVEAIKAYPEAQAGFVGVSELLYVDAQPESAAKVMTNLLQKPAPSDPWWVYVMGEWWHYDARLRAMRNRVRQ